MALTPHMAAEGMAGGGPLAPRAVRGGLWVALGSYTNVGFGFLANLLLTRILAPEHFGIFALGTFYFSLTNLRTKIGIGRAFAQRQETTGELLATHLGLDVLVGLLTLVVAGAAVPVLRALGCTPDVAWVVLALAVIGLSDSVMATASLLMDKELQFGQSSLVSSVAFPLSYVPGLWLALHGGGYWSLVAQNGAYALFLLAGMWWVAWRRLPQIRGLRWRFDRVLARELLRFGGWVGLATVAGLLLTQFDNFLVGAFVGLAALGYYDRAYRIAQWPSVVLWSVVNRTAFQAYARLQEDPPRLARAVTMTMWLISLVATPLALAVFAAAPDLVALLYGQRWLPSALFVRFLVVYSLLRPLLDNAGSLFVAVGRPRRATVIVAAQMVALVAVATPLTLAYGVLGTCIGVGVAFVIGLALAYHHLRRVVALAAGDTLAVPALAAAAALAGYGLVSRGVGFGALPLAARVVAKGGLTTAIFAVAMMALSRRVMLARLSYLWRLLRAGGQPVANPAHAGE